jgi:hypothetical protein
VRFVPSVGQSFTVRWLGWRRQRLDQVSKVRFSHLQSQRESEGEREREKERKRESKRERKREKKRERDGKGKRGCMGRERVEEEESRPKKNIKRKREREKERKKVVLLDSPLHSRLEEKVLER